MNESLYGVTFSTNGEYLLSGGVEGVQVGRVENGKQMATVNMVGTICLAVPYNGRWIAAGTHKGQLFVWDAETPDSEEVMAAQPR